MTVYEIKAPNGQILEIKGDIPPTEAELDEIFSQTGTNEQVSKQPSEQVSKQPIKKGIDLTPSGLAKGSADNIINLIATPIKAIQEGKTLPETWQENKEKITQYRQENPTPIKDLLLDIAGYSAIPTPNAKVAGLAKLGQFAGQAAIQGGIPAALETLKQGGDVAKGALMGTGLAGALQGISPVAKIAGKLPIVKPILESSERIGKGALQGLHESFAMGKDTVKRLMESPRGTEISRNAEYFGSPEFITGVADRLKNGIDQLKNQEIKAFAQARDDLLAQNKDANIDLSEPIQEAYKKMIDKGLITAKGEITRIGKKADNLSELLGDLYAYMGKQGVDNAQRFKTNILDDVINYKPQVGQNLSQSTRDIQGILKKLRKGVNDKLNQKLGSEYTQANKQLSEVLEGLNNVPELKDITNATNIDTLANKLKRTGTTRFQTGQELEKLENLMNKNNVQISENGIINDILDYNAAKEINSRIRTGQDAQFRNVIRKSLVQPMTEFTIDRLLPMVDKTKQAIQPLKRAIIPTLSRQIAPLKGGIEYNE